MNKSKKFKLNASRRRALEILSEYRTMDMFAQSVEGIQTRTLDALYAEGLVTYRPYAKDPGWAITTRGLDVALRFKGGQPK